MDRGEFIKGGYTVEPGDGGSWVVSNGGSNFLIATRRGFTNYLDLLDWLREEHEMVGTGGNELRQMVDQKGNLIRIPSYILDNLPPALRALYTEAPK